jgi:hypothetical protein
MITQKKNGGGGGGGNYHGPWQNVGNNSEVGGGRGGRGSGGEGGGGGGGGGEPPPKNLNLTPEDPQWVCISAKPLHWDLYVLLGEGAVTPSGGLATFDEVVVPTGKTLLSWTGEDLWHLELPLMFDTWADDLDEPKPSRVKQAPRFEEIEKKQKRRRARERWRRVRDNSAPSQPHDFLSLIADLGKPSGKRGGRFPQPLRIYGKALRPKEINGISWHITEWSWSENYLYNRDGQLRRQGLTLTLTEAHRGSTINLKHEKDKEPGTDQDFYVVKKGDTLQSIAAHVYGDANKWERIAEANKIKNPRKLKVGDRLKIPR